VAEPAELIFIDDVTKRYGTVTALANVTLAVRRGEFLALLGPSGCGKTTLLRLVGGFGEPTEGEIRMDGQRLNEVPPNRRPVNTVFQNYALFPHLTVAENVAFGPRRASANQADIPRAVEDTLALVGMAGYGGRYPAELSGGQQQRIALARAIINRPRVLLLDEPLGALDLQLRKRMQLELKHLQARLGITFIFVTHDQEEALVMADRIAVMNEGRLMQVGTGEEIYRNPTSRFVASFIGEANLLPAQAEGSGIVLKGSRTPLPYPSSGIGSECVLMVRPEDVDLGTGAPDPAYVALDATVRERVFLGNSVRVHTVLPGGEELVLRPSETSAVERLSPGEPITVHWRADRARVLDY
jgi:spermidine/putrescine transport system ATP-binding protein